MSDFSAKIIVLMQRASKEDGESPTQADIFIETRKSKKGKKVDEETNNVIVSFFL